MTRSTKDRDILHSRVKHAVIRTPKDLLLSLISIIESLQKVIDLYVENIFQFLLGTSVELYYN